MFENRLYTVDELSRDRVNTQDYIFMNEPCVVNAVLVLKAYSRRYGKLRMFFILEDGRKILTPVFWFNDFCGLREIDIGTRLRLTYIDSNNGYVNLSRVEVLGE